MYVLFAQQQFAQPVCDTSILVSQTALYTIDLLLDIAMSPSVTPSLLCHVATQKVQSACRSTGHVLVRLSRAPPRGGAHAARVGGRGARSGV
eukprot:COSAG01_NODE_3983_length_5467_cov_3.221498_1_plen_91_part_10